MKRIIITNKEGVIRMSQHLKSSVIVHNCKILDKRYLEYQYPKYIKIEKRRITKCVIGIFIKF